MKKVNKSSIPPVELSNYVAANPTDDWDNFYNNDRQGYGAIKKQLISDQKGLCAYCENDLKSGGGVGLDDFRVEHFYPKKPHTPPPNWALDWNNMLGVCFGGSNRGVTDSRNRFTSPDHSCDVPKGNKNLIDQIVNPLTDIPTYPCFFRYVEHTGEIKVDQSVCPTDLVDRVNQTIVELRLNASRLQLFRRVVIGKLREKIKDLLNQGINEKVAITKVAEEMLWLNSANQWPKFFTCIRWYLGQAAETQLQSIHYQG
jgi:uncharacterized protein (TIGR02646 family)